MDFDRSWPAAEVVIRRLADLKPDPENARTHSQEQVAQIAGMMRSHGWTIPMLVDENDVIIAGHGRWQAARELGITEASVITARGWTPEQKRAYQIADNQIALNSGWDMSRLSVQLSDLQGSGFDLNAIGFSPVTLESLLAGGSAPGASDGTSSGQAHTDPVEAKRKLADRFGVVPFSVLNAREGWWQARKSAWIALGIQSELGRGENLIKFSETILEPDPVKRAAKRAETTVVVAGNGWANGGPARRDAAFYAKKRAWEKANGRKISTTEFREKHWDGAAEVKEPT